MNSEQVVKQAPEVIYVASQNQGIDWSLLANFVLILITVIGWVIVYWLNIKQQKENLKNNLSIKVYEEFWKFRTDFHNNILSFDKPPFILMNLSKIQIFKSDEIMEKQKAIRYLMLYLDEIKNKKIKFSNVFMNFWRSLETWMCLMPDLEKAKNDLTREYLGVIKASEEYMRHLQKLEKDNWEKWNQEDLEKRSEIASSEALNLYCYIEDMMLLIHDELVSPLFKNKIPKRQPIGKQSCILTKKGLVYKNINEE